MIFADGIPVHCAHDELVDIINLVPNPRNPNQHPKKQIELLAKIIKNQGWRAPITVSSRSGFIVRGHGRLLAAQSLGISQVPIDRQDYENEAAEWADLVADNRIAELSQVDNELLENLISELKTEDIDLELTGFNEKEIDKILGVDDSAYDEAETKEAKFNYQEQYGVIVMCSNEAHQEQVYTQLKEMGFDCKVVSV